MGCGCGKKSVTSTRLTIRPSVGPRSVQGGIAAGVSPSTLRAAGLQTSVSVGQSRRMDEQRLRLEKLRRDAIQKRLNK